MNALQVQKNTEKPFFLFAMKVSHSLRSEIELIDFYEYCTHNFQMQMSIFSLCSMKVWFGSISDLDFKKSLIYSKLNQLDLS